MEFDSILRLPKNFVSKGQVPQGGGDSGMRLVFTQSLEHNTKPAPSKLHCVDATPLPCGKLNNETVPLRRESRSPLPPVTLRPNVSPAETGIETEGGGFGNIVLGLPSILHLTNPVHERLV